MKALCQDCLRVVEVSQMEMHDKGGDAMCPHCHGDVCDCSSCLDCMRSLAAGVRERGRLYMKPGPDFDWTPDGGYVARVPS